MTVINMTAQDAAAIKTPDDVIDYYKGVDDSPFVEDRTQKIGIEIEKTAYFQDSLKPLDIETNEALVKAGEDIGMPVHYEPSATLLETISDPFPKEQLGDLIAQMDERFTKLQDLETAKSIAYSSFGHLPHIKAADHTLIQNERYKAMWNPYRDDMEFSFRSFLYPSIQTSISYRDWDQLLRIIRLCTALEPIFFLMTDASAGIFEGEAIDYNPWLHLRSRRGPNGGIPDFYYSAKTGEEFIRAHITHSMTHQHVFVYFNDEGELQQLPSGEWASFDTLEEKNLGPQNFLNYRQAQSESWRRACNISTINAPDGSVITHRAEMNMLATGLQHQRGTAALVCYSVAFCNHFYPRVTELLHKFGIDIESLDSCLDLLEKNFEAGVYHGNKFHDLPFGTGSMKDFAIGFADVLEQCHSSGKFDDYLAPALHILRSGRPDWLVYRETFPDLESLTNYLKLFPDLVKDNPDLLSAKSCADFVVPDLAKSLAA